MSDPLYLDLITRANLTFGVLLIVASAAQYLYGRRRNARDQDRFAKLCLVAAIGGLIAAISSFLPGLEEQQSAMFALLPGVIGGAYAWRLTQPQTP